MATDEDVYLIATEMARINGEEDCIDDYIFPVQFAFDAIEAAGYKVVKDAGQ